jgi:DNA-binding MarR family transcriptional regulator
MLGTIQVDCIVLPMDTDELREFTLDDANGLRRAVGAFVRVIRHAETTPEGQIEVLGFLTRDGAASIAALARLRRVRHQTMRVTVADLESQGLVARVRDPSDARGVLVSLTPTGERMIAESRIRRSARVLAAARAALTPEERAVLVAAASALDRLTEVLRVDDAS